MATKTMTPQRKTSSARARQAPPPKAVDKNSRRKWLIAAAAITLIAAIFTTVKLKHVIVPPELVGTWKTSNPDYKDRSLEIGSESLSFYTGRGTQYTGFIDHIESDTDKNGMFYTIYYVVDGNKTQMSLYYNSADGGTLQFKNQLNMVWKKESSS